MSQSISRLKIVIPGRIDVRKRYYDWIDYFPDDLLNSVSIQLLGRPVSTSDNFIIDFFEKRGIYQKFAKRSSFIDFKDFDDEILGSDFLLCPFVKCKSSYESVNQVSGALFDSVRYGKPIIVPFYTPIPDELKNSVIKYENDHDLVTLCSRLICDFHFRNNILNKAFNNSKNFKLDNLTYYSEIESLKT